MGTTNSLRQDMEHNLFPALEEDLGPIPIRTRNKIEKWYMDRRWRIMKMRV
jgi:hypothetical protein